MSTDLNDRFVSDLKLRGYAERTIESYVRAVRKLQEFCNRSLEEVSEELLREYWIFCKDKLQWGTASFRVSYSGIRHFFEMTIKRDWPTLREVRFERCLTLPSVLSIDEVQLILDALAGPQNVTFFKVLYSLGLRLGEAVSLQIRDIDSARMLVHLHNGKGGRDRLIPLPESTLTSLREYWVTHRNPVWIFPGLGRSGQEGPTTEQHVSRGTVQGALRRALLKLNISKHVHPHTFRHSYATHLIEAGVPVRHVQEYLGHQTLAATVIYLHLTTAGQQESHDRISQLMQGVLS